MNPFRPQPTAKEVADELGASMLRANAAVASALQQLAPFMDANPKGLDAVVAAATLRAYADVMEMRFGEGNKMGPLKLAVDETRTRILKAMQGG